MPVFNELLKLLVAENRSEVIRIRFVGTTLIVLTNISKVVEVASLKLVKDLFVLRRGRATVLLHEVAADSKSEALDAAYPIHVANVKREIPPRMEGQRIVDLCVPHLLVDVLVVYEVAEDVLNVDHLFLDLF